MSPAARYLQFRLYFPVAGTVLHRLVFEYAAPPLVQELRAEIEEHVREEFQKQRDGMG